jgi:hypothetical protein
MGSLIGKILNSSLLSESVKGALDTALISGDKRLVYVAVLTAAASRASNKSAFNLEVEMNDLWTSLSNLRDVQGGNRFGGAMQASLQAVIPQLSRILDSLGKAK